MRNHRERLYIHRSLAIQEIKRILETKNENTAFMDAREIWEQVLKPLLELEADAWLEFFNGRSNDKH